MSLLLLDDDVAPARRGLVRASHHVIQDDTGVFHPLGLTFFWALYGWRHERDRVLAHLRWLAPKGFDYLRILGEVDWEGRSIDPRWPDYLQVLREFVDCAYDQFGLRTELTIVGGQPIGVDGTVRFEPADLALRVADALADRAHKLMLYEMANEADNGSGGYAEKVTLQDLIEMATFVEEITPNLVSLSRPTEPAEVMKAATTIASGSSYTPHPRRSSHDHGWSHVRQGYDFRDFDRAVWNNEPEGPQSSVVAMDNPLQLACCRLLGILCGGAGYVLHVAQGVTGIADPNHGRPQNMWEVPNIDAIMATVRGVDALLPLGVENWKVVNNGRSDHPLPLHPHDGFWESDDDRAPAVNKNYAALSGQEFVEILTGVKSAGVFGPVPVGTARRPMQVEAFDPVSRERVDAVELAAGESWTLEGVGDSMAAYLIRGRYV